MTFQIPLCTQKYFPMLMTGRNIYFKKKWNHNFDVAKHPIVLFITSFVSLSYVLSYNILIYFIEFCQPFAIGPFKLFQLLYTPLPLPVLYRPPTTTFSFPLLLRWAIGQTPHLAFPSHKFFPISPPSILSTIFNWRVHHVCARAFPVLTSASTEEWAWSMASPLIGYHRSPSTPLSTTAPPVPLQTQLYSSTTACQPQLEGLENAGRLVDDHLKEDASFVELSGQLRIASHSK